MSGLWTTECIDPSATHNGTHKFQEEHEKTGVVDYIFDPRISQGSSMTQAAGPHTPTTFLGPHESPPVLWWRQGVPDGNRHV